MQCHYGLGEKAVFECQTGPFLDMENAKKVKQNFKTGCLRDIKKAVLPEPKHDITYFAIKYM